MVYASHRDNKGSENGPMDLTKSILHSRIDTGQFVDSTRRDNTIERQKFERERQETWDRYNMRTASCRLRAQDYERFREYCADRGKTVHSLLRMAILHVLKEEQNGGHSFQSHSDGW